MASVWMDKKPLSTLAQADATHTAQKNSSRVSVQCTDMVVSYNTWEGLVKEINSNSTTSSELDVVRVYTTKK